MKQCGWLLLLKCMVIIIFVYFNIITQFYKDFLCLKYAHMDLRSEAR